MVWRDRSRRHRRQAGRQYVDEPLDRHELVAVVCDRCVDEYAMISGTGGVEYLILPRHSFGAYFRDDGVDGARHYVYDWTIAFAGQDGTPGDAGCGSCLSFVSL